MMRGCDKYMVYSYSNSIKMNQESLEAVINGSCDLLPASSLPTMPSNFSQDMKCIAGNHVFEKYLFNSSASQKNLCEVFMKMSDCVLDNSGSVALPWRKALESVSHLVKKQVYFRCKVVGELNGYKGIQYETICFWSCRNVNFKSAQLFPIYVLSALFFCIDNCIFTSQEFTNHYALL